MWPPTSSKLSGAPALHTHTFHHLTLTSRAGLGPLYPRSQLRNSGPERPCQWYSWDLHVGPGSQPLAYSPVSPTVTPARARIPLHRGEARCRSEPLLPQAKSWAGSGLGRRQEGGAAGSPCEDTGRTCGAGLATSPAHVWPGLGEDHFPDSTQEDGCSWAVNPRKSQCETRTEIAATCQDSGV